MNGDQDGTTADYAYHNASEALERIKRLERIVESLCVYVTYSAENKRGHQRVDGVCVLCGNERKTR